MPFASIPEALEDFRQGKMVVVVDDEDRENEGDLTVAAAMNSHEIYDFRAPPENVSAGARRCWHVAQLHG